MSESEFTGLTIAVAMAAAIIVCVLSFPGVRQNLYMVPQAYQTMNAQQYDGGSVL